MKPQLSPNGCPPEPMEGNWFMKKLLNLKKIDFKKLGEKEST